MTSIKVCLTCSALALAALPSGQVSISIQTGPLIGVQKVPLL